MGSKSKKEGIYVYVQLIHFAVQQKLRHHCNSNYTPIKTNKKNVFFHLVVCTEVTIYVLFCLLLGFPGGSAGKQSTHNVGDLGSIPGLGRSHGEGKGYPLQYSGLENSMDCIVHGVARS